MIFFNPLFSSSEPHLASSSRHDTDPSSRSRLNVEYSFVNTQVCIYLTKSPNVLFLFFFAFAISQHNAS